MFCLSSRWLSELSSEGPFSPRLETTNISEHIFKTFSSTDAFVVAEAIGLSTASATAVVRRSFSATSAVGSA